MKEYPIKHWTVEKSQTVLMAGTGGFIGGHLVGALVKNGFRKIRAIDIKPWSE